ncbi:MAG: CYTH domain-containing protein [Prevotellaceae bacterium]|jgi:adenylate cyclase|nr:CYTH domain-containing protein [Prevotellaceae bacterium]
MPKEIERKFLTTNSGYRQVAKGESYKQGYICRLPDKIVRIRIAGNKAFIAIKGMLHNAITRLEYEYEIPVDHAEEMLQKFCEKPLIEKTRYKVPWGKNIWEIDEFHGDNEGLIVAEIEMPSEDYQFELPPWVGKEVTDDSRYLNANLVLNPYKSWK